MTLLRAAAETHTGYVRTANQDQAVVSGDLVAVADGMGGHRGGEVAARTAIEELVAAFTRDRSAAGLANAVRRANRAIWRRSRVDRKLHGMGTTLTAAALVEGSGPDSSGPAHVMLVNIGDSRAYRLTEGGASIEQLTEDHTVVEEMVRQGELSPAEAAVHPHRHVLTRALGIDPDAEPDEWDLELDLGSRFLLCSDGLTNEVAEDEIAEVLRAQPDPADAARELVGRALGHGGMDNVTVVVIDVDAGDAAAVPLQLVPPRPTELATGVDRGSDVTQAIPVATPPESSREEGSGGDPSHGSPVGDVRGESPDATRAMSVVEMSAAGAAALAAGAAGAGAAGETTPGRGSGVATTAGSPPAGTLGNGSDPPSGRHRIVEPDSGPMRTTGHHRPVVLVPERGRVRSLGDRIVTFRVALFVLVLAGLIAGSIGVVIWFNQSSYYVGISGDHLAIYQGRPGGMLWFKPSLVETSPLRTKDVLPATLRQLRSGVSESSLAAARTLIAYLGREHSFLYMAGEPPTSVPGTMPPASTLASPSSTSPATSSTTAAPTSTTVAPTTSTTAPSTTTTTTSPTTTTTTPVPTTTVKNG